MGSTLLKEFCQGVGAAVGVPPSNWSMVFLAEVLFCMDRWVKHSKFNLSGPYEKQEQDIQRYMDWLMGYGPDGENKDVVSVVTRFKSAASVRSGNAAPVS